MQLNWWVLLKVSMHEALDSVLSTEWIECEAGGWEAQGHFQLHSEFKAKKKYLTPPQKCN